ncbi:MAG: cobalamin-dependent protein [Myxococcales bacterium]|nr:cobalamin-dependent protein [Myxococcales bacterium]
MDVLLAGLSLPGVPNHSLAVLESALARAGLGYERVSFAGFGDLDAVCQRVRAQPPRVLGISIQASAAALPSLTLAQLLRRRGYRGRIVCGGHVSTLAAEQVLAASPAIDAVVRFAGERALSAIGSDPELLDDPRRIAEVPGLIARARDGRIYAGAPADIGAPLLTPGPGEGGEHLGHTAVDLVLSRGCDAQCAYCCVAGATQLAREQARQGGTEADYVRHLRSDSDAIALTIAGHYDAGARVFNLMDDNLLPLDPGAAETWIRQLGKALRIRGVGPIALSMQLRADVIDDAVAAALVDLGLVRAYVGIDATSPGQLRTLGRSTSADAGERALAALWQRGVYAVCNNLLVGPTHRFERIVDEVEALGRIAHAPVHLLPIDARPGTRITRRAEARGLLEGGFLWRRYRFEDARTGRLARLLAGLPTRLAERSVPMALYDLGYNAGIASRLDSDVPSDFARDAYATLSARWNVNQMQLLRAGLSAAADSDAAVDALLQRERPRVRAFDRQLIAECDGLMARLERALSERARRPVHAHRRGQLLAGVALSMAMAACWDDHGRNDLRDGGMKAAIPPSQLAMDAASEAPSTIDAALANDSGRLPLGAGVVRVGVCEPPEFDAGADEGPVNAAAPPLLDLLNCYPCVGRSVALQFCFDHDGRAVSVQPADADVEDWAAKQACILELLADYRYPSYAGLQVEYEPICWIA